MQPRSRPTGFHQAAPDGRREARRPTCYSAVWTQRKEADGSGRERVTEQEVSRAGVHPDHWRASLKRHGTSIAVEDPEERVGRAGERRRELQLKCLDAPSRGGNG